MAVEHKVSIGYNDGATNHTNIETISTGSGETISEAIPATADNLIAFTCDASQLKGIYMESDVNLTVETNSTTVPADTFEIGPDNGILLYTTKLNVVNPITADITALYVTNQGSTAGTLTIAKAEDPTV